MIIAFHLHDRTMWMIIRVHVSWNKLNQEWWTHHIYKNKRGQVHTRFSYLSQSIIYRHIAFHLHDRTMWIIIRVHMHYTKLESTNIYSDEKTRYYGLFVRSTIIHMRAAHHFHQGLLLTAQRKEKNFKEREKLFTRESSQQAKEEREIFLGFHFFNYYFKQRK